MKTLSALLVVLLFSAIITFTIIWFGWKLLIIFFLVLIMNMFVSLFNNSDD